MRLINNMRLTTRDYGSVHYTIYNYKHKKTERKLPE